MKPQNTPVVVTGSAAQVPPEIASQLGIVILPLVIIVEGKEYLDGIDLFPSDLYQKMRTQKIEVKTAAPNVGQYYACFKRIIDQQESDVLCISLSGKLSSDYTAAVDAAKMLSGEYPRNKVTVIDSLRAAAPQGLLAVEAAKRLRAGETIEDVVQYLMDARHRSGLIAALDSLDYLAQGGRIGKAAYLVGSVLQIVPILTINDEGIVAPSTIIRKKEKIIPGILSILAKETPGFTKLGLSVMHADAVEEAEVLRQSLNIRVCYNDCKPYVEEAEVLRQSLKELYPTLDIPIGEFTPVMGAHAGPGLIGLGYLYE